MGQKVFKKTQAIPEGSTRRYSALLVGFDGLPLQSGQVTSIKMSLINARTGDVINGRDRVQVRNANGGLWSPTTAPGYLYMTLNALDTVTVDTEPYQPRKMIFEVTFLDGIENHEVFFWVANVAHLTQAS